MKKTLFVISIILLVLGVYSSYKKTKELNEMVCQGCIAIISKSLRFEEFWVEYPPGYGMKGVPEHAEWAINYSKGNILMLFFYGPACEPCEQQWEEMKKTGIVLGDKKNGEISENFSYVKLVTIDISNDEKDTIKIYNPKSSVPTTVIMFEKNDEIYWFAFFGPPDGAGGRPSIDELKIILEKARDKKWSAV